MPKKIATLFFKEWFIAGTLALIFFFINFHYFTTFITAWIFPGYDGSSHVAIGEYYANHIFPKTWGWVPNWFAGLPFPQFYTPLFYFVAAIIYKILPFSFLTVVKTIVLSNLFLVPYLLSRITRKLSGSTKAAWLTGLCAIFVLSTFYYSYSSTGITLQNSINVGLVTQLFGFVLFLIWLEFFLEWRKSARAKFGAVIMLSLVLISNTHIVPIAMSLLVVFFVGEFFSIIRKHQSGRSRIMGGLVKDYSILALLPLVLVSFWYIPLFYYWHFLAGISLDQVSGRIVFLTRYWPQLAGIIFGGMYAYRIRNKKMFFLAVAFFVIACIVSIPLYRISDGSLPIHTYRYIGPLGLLSLILLGTIMSALTNRFKRHIQILCFGLVILVFLVPFISSLNAPRLAEFYLDEDKDEIKAMMRFFKERPELVSIENPGGVRNALTRGLYAELGREGGFGNFSVFIEPSISSIFMPTVQNSFSRSTYAHAIHSSLYLSSDYLRRPLDERIDKAIMMGVKFLVVQSPYIYDSFADSNRLREIANFGIWKVFEITDDVPLSFLPPQEPTLVFSSLSFKKRTDDPYEYTRLQEELLWQNITKTVLAYANNQNLDETRDLDNFSSVLIANYTYKNKKNATERLTEYAKNNTLILLSSADPLFIELAAISNPHIHIIERGVGAYYSNATSATLEEIVKTVEKLQKKMPVPQEKVHAERAGSCIKVSGGNGPPLVLKSSFFPSMRSSDNSPLYLATPTFTLGFFKENATVCMKTDPIIPFSYAISLVGLILAGFFYQKERKEKNN